MMLGVVWPQDILASLLKLWPPIELVVQSPEDWCSSASRLSAFWEQHGHNTCLSEVFTFPPKRPQVGQHLQLTLDMMDTAGSYTHRGTEHGAQLRHSLCWRKLHPHFISWPHASHPNDREIVRPRAYIRSVLLSDRKEVNPAMKAYQPVRTHGERLEQPVYETWQSPLQSYLSSRAAEAAGTLCAAPPPWDPHPLG